MFILELKLKSWTFKHFVIAIEELKKLRGHYFATDEIILMQEVRAPDFTVMYFAIVLQIFK